MTKTSARRSVASSAVFAVLAFAGLAVAQPGGGGANQPSAGMLRWPDVSKTHIVFSYANDLWVVPKTGGVALPLSTASGQERLPRFSPDGQTVAFVGNYEGNWDLYTLPVNGGAAVRATYHPSSETLADWTPDGKLLYITNGFAGLARQSQLWKTDAKGGLPEKLPVPYGGFGAVSPDGEWLAYTPHSTDTRTWKRYRGGMATDIWLYNLKTNASKKITDWEGTDTIPMWVPGGKGDKVYYLSDMGPEHRLNIWSYSVSGGERVQVTKFADDDVKWPSIGPGDSGEGEIVFQLGSQLRLLNLKSGESKVVSVTVPGDKPAVRARQVDAAKNVASAGISPTGKRVAVEARGDIWTVPGKEGVSRNLTRTDGFYERSPAYSPDGKWIAYFSDASGEYELYIRPSDATPAEKKPDADKKNAEDAGKKEGEEGKKEDGKKDDAAKEKKPSVPSRALPSVAKKLTNLGPGFRMGTQFSPDSQWITFTDQAGRLYLLNVETQAISVVDQDPGAQAVSPSWSHDSAWLAYGRMDEGNSQSAVWLYNVKGDTKTRVTDPMFSSYQPCFDRAGDWLYFASNRAVSRPVYSDLDGAFAYVDTSLLYAVPLRGDVKNPFLPKADEETVKEEKKEGSAAKKDEKGKGDEKKEEKKDEGKKDEPKKDEPNKDDTKKDDAKKEPEKKKDKPAIKIDLDGFEARAIQLPLGNGLFGGMTVADGGKLVYVRRAKIRDDEGPGGSGASIKLYDINAEAKDRKEETIGDGGGFDISADGKKLLLMRGGANMAICDVAPGAAAKATTVPTGDMKVTIEPRDEWRQIILDTHRIYRDYFYEPTMHGVNWDGVRDHYLKMVDDAVTREDVAYIQAEMVSELNVGHAYISSPGEVESSPQNAGVGLLGCDYEFVKGDGNNAGRYRIKHIVRGGQWDADAVGPLAQPGVDIKEGDYLLAVNGVEVDAAKDPWAAFLNTAGKTTTVTVSSSPTLDDKARDVLVRPVGSEGDLRYREWIEAKRAYVAKKSEGAIGYMYVPNTGVDGQSDLWRQFYGQRNKPALIIDERWNGGGQIPNRFIELLNRPVTNYWAKRDGVDWVWPPDSHYGAGGGGNQCILINGLAGSGGDMFPWLFKHHKLGPAIGTRTWGGLVGISGNPGLIDGGVITVPTFGFYKTDGHWGIEGHGTDPDIEVLDDPALMVNGGDPQLDRGIEEMLKANKANPKPRPARPASPDRKGMGSLPADR